MLDCTHFLAVDHRLRSKKVPVCHPLSLAADSTTCEVHYFWLIILNHNQAGDGRNALLDAIRRSSKAVLKPASEVQENIKPQLNLISHCIQRAAPTTGEKKKGNGWWDALKDKLMVWAARVSDTL